MTVFATGLVSE